MCLYLPKAYQLILGTRFNRLQPNYYNMDGIIVVYLGDLRE